VAEIPVQQPTRTVDHARRMARALAGFFLLCFLVLHFAVKRHTWSSSEGLAGTGGSAKSFEATTLDHTKIDLAAVAKGRRLVILNFWESWCGPCKIEMPELQQLYLAHKDEGLEIIGVYRSSPEQAVLSAVEEQSLSFPLLCDHDGAISTAYGVNGVPTTVVVDSELKIVRRHLGIDRGLTAFVTQTLRTETHGGSRR